MPSGIRERKKNTTQLKYSNPTKDVLLSPVLSSYLHGSGTHVCQDFFSGTGILVITKSCMEALLQAQNIKSMIHQTLKNHILFKYLCASMIKGGHWRAMLPRTTGRCWFPTGHRAPAAHPPFWFWVEGGDGAGLPRGIWCRCGWLWRCWPVTWTPPPACRADTVTKVNRAKEKSGWLKRYCCTGVLRKTKWSFW